VEIKVVTDTITMLPPLDNKRKIFRRNQIIALSELFAIERAGTYHLLMTDNLHDRHLRVDGKIFDLGGSVERAAMDSSYGIKNSDSNPTLQAELDRDIGNGVPWYQPGFAAHRRWCLTCNGPSDVKRSGACAVCNAPL
jgi:hypothetical protein